jgi:glycosyltransferase involved in cell wall biosynthesis
VNPLGRIPRIGPPSSVRPHVLLVSPPATPPWLNGTSLLARHLAVSATGFQHHLLGCSGQVNPGGMTQTEPIYGSFRAEGILGKARVFLRLLKPDRCRIHHFLFSPNPKSIRAAKLALSINRRLSIHTIPSQARPGQPLETWTFADRTVVLTEATALLLRTAGIGNITVIRPGIPLPPRPNARSEYRRRLALSYPDLLLGHEPLYVYPGDLEFSDGARVFVEAAAMAAHQAPHLRFALACRPKTAASYRVQEGLMRRVAKLGLSKTIHFLGVVSDMPALLGSATAVSLVVDELYGKVDTPWVLLESMALGVPVVVSNLCQLEELAGLGQGVLTSPQSDPEKLAALFVTLSETPTRLQRLGTAARRTIATHFRADAMAAAYESLYRELLDA